MQRLEREATQRGPTARSRFIFFLQYRFPQFLAQRCNMQTVLYLQTEGLVNPELQWYEWNQDTERLPNKISEYQYHKTLQRCTGSQNSPL